jgi:hypothetical protein
MTWVPTENGVYLLCQGLSGVFYTSDFRYRETIFVATGHADVKMNTINLGVGIKFITQAVTGRILPAIDPLTYSLTLTAMTLTFKSGATSGQTSLPWERSFSRV